MSFKKKYEKQDARQEWDEKYVEQRRASFTIWNLKRMKTTEIVMKLCAVLWAVVWSATGIFCLFSDEYKLLTPLPLMPAVGFWVLLAHSAGSVTEIDQEIRKIKKTIDEI